MRGNVWVKCDVWMITRTGDKWKNTSEIMYGFSSTGELNSNYQREDAFRRAINRAIKIYRNEHTLSSDDEINYHLIGSGIQYVGIDKETGKQHRTSWKNVRISTSSKRRIHKEVFLGKDKPIKVNAMKQEEKTLKEYEGKTKHNERETNKYIIDTGKMKHKRPKETYNPPVDKTLKPLKIIVKRKNIRGYLGMNNPASKELHLSKKSRPKRNEIFIDKSLKGRKKRQVIAHEIYEQQQMNKGMKYKQAHKKALKIEKKVK